jgi:hypothetical protein
MGKLHGALIAAALALPGAAAAQVDGCVITFYGTYTAQTQKRQASAASPTGTETISTDFQPREKTDRIRAELNGRFGVQFVVTGKTPDGFADVIRVRRFPGEGLRNPKTGKTFNESRGLIRVRLGERQWTGYKFDEDWEMQPGEWVFEIWDGPQRLCRQAFTVSR